MNNVPSEIKAQCDHLLEWMQNRCDEIVEDKQYEDMYSLYMEWHEWIEEENPSVMVLGHWDEEEGCRLSLWMGKNTRLSVTTSSNCCWLF